MRHRLAPHGGSKDFESLRPAVDLNWVRVRGGEWYEDAYHNGWAAYEVAKVGPGRWLLGCVEWNGCLDDLTQEDVDEGRLNDDQLQAMWGKTLEEAQSARHCWIAGEATEVPEDWDAAKIGRFLYDEAVKAGGFDLS